MRLIRSYYGPCQVPKYESDETEGFILGAWKNTKGGSILQENRVSFSLYAILLSIFAFLFIGVVSIVLSGCTAKSKQAKASHENVSEKRNIAELPKMGEIVTTERALELCVYYGLNHLERRIEENPDFFKMNC